MKEHKIDQLFRQKLQQHSVAPTPAAWDKVATGLNHRRRKRGGYYAAAAVMVLLLSAGWFWLEQNNAPDYQQQLAVTEQPKAVPGAAAPSAETPAQEEPAYAAGTEATASPGAQNPATDAAKIPDTASETAASQKVTTPAASINTSYIAATQQEPALPAEQATESAAALPEATAETTLAQALPEAPGSQKADLELHPEAISAPSAELAFAKAEQVVIRYDAADASSPEEKPDSAPEKVLSLLQKVKHGDVGLADIRNAKDNLFSGRFNKP
ncbi:hypothetical protein [Cesiribacter sp. SM1]|uniref:hypothetical protein n=1 Tax=Cesiribacter sp. SM1 TaxID=2861196 RepID=UPI001CD48D12|nr:hypothetical protein [Cesiribacter sp. SM1]